MGHVNPFLISQPSSHPFKISQQWTATLTIVELFIPSAFRRGIYGYQLGLVSFNNSFEATSKLKTKMSAATQPPPNQNNNEPGVNNNNSVFTALLRGVMMYFFLNMMKSNPKGTTTTSSTSPAETLSKMKPRGADSNQNHLNLNHPGVNRVRPTCVWDFGSLLDLHVYITDSNEYTTKDCLPQDGKKNENKNNVLAEWHESDLTFGSASGASSTPNRSINPFPRSTNVTIPLPDKVQFNQTHIYAHVCMIRTSSPSTKEHKTIHIHDYDDNLSKNVLLKTIKLTTHKKRKRIRNEKNLLSKSSLSSSSFDDDQHIDSDNSSSNKKSPLTIASANTTEDCTLLYLKPTLSLQLVDMKGLPTFPERRSIPIQVSTHMTWFNDTNNNDKSDKNILSSSIYYPILYSSEFWILKSSYVELNDTISSTNIEISVNDVSFWKWQLMTQMEESWNKQSALNDGDDDSSTDMLRTMLLETNPILLAVTFIVSVLHTIFDILAFKNDINFFKGKKSMEGLSLRSMIINTAFQIVILLYLLDNDTSFMILVSNGVSVAIELWKISKAFKLSIMDENGKWNFQWEETETYSKSTTKEFDETATDHLMFVTTPLVCGYGLYSLFYQKHKGWYSWILNTLVGFIYMFGFVMMTPQLFINYKLQSVAHLNWRTMTYKSINTFIDDLFGKNF